VSIIHNTEQRGKKSDDLSDFSDLTHDTNEIICRIKMAALWAFGTNIVFKRLCCGVYSPLAAFSSKSRNPGDPDYVLR